MDRIEKLKAFLKTNHADSFLQHALALEYIKVGDEKEARALFESILDREPTYVGTYYHLGKLLERIGETEKAVIVYENGMVEAKKQSDQHSYNELYGAYEDLTM